MLFPLEDLLPRIAFLWGMGVQVGLWMECCFFCFLKVFLASQLVGLESLSGVHLSHWESAGLQNAWCPSPWLWPLSSFSFSGKPGMLGAFCRWDQPGSQLLLCFGFYLFIFRERGREGEGNINVWLPLVHPLLGTWPATQACALPGNRTGDSGLWAGTQSTELHQPELN